MTGGWNVTWSWKALSLFAAFFLFQLGQPTFAFADTVTVQTQQSVGYDRITFRWPQPVGHTVKRQGDLMVISFSRPIQANLRPIVKKLARVISVEPAPNVSTVILRIKGKFSVRSYDSGSSVVVDIVKEAAKTTSKSQKGNAKTGPKVTVRAGVHPKYSRIVFDWKNKPGFKLSQVGDTVTLTFGKPATVNLSQFAKGRIRHVRAATSSLSNGKLSVVFKVAATSQVKAFAMGARVVLDVAAPTGKAVVPTTPSPAIKKASAASQGAPTPKAAPVKKVVTKPVALVPPTAIATSKPGQVQKNTPKPVAQKPLKSMDVKTETVAKGVVDLRFNWDEPVAAAVFRRGGALWLVFDKGAKIDTKALARGGKGLVMSVEQVMSNTGTVLRMTTSEGINPTIKRSGLSWILEFSKQPLAPNTALKADAQPASPLGARLFVSVPEPGSVVAFRDPEIGDNLIVVPVIPLSHGLSRRWKYPQFQLLASKQGVVVRPLADDVRVRPLRQGVEISSTGTLQVSAVSAEQKANIELEAARAAGGGMKAEGPLSRVMDLEKWKRQDLQDFIVTRQDLQRAVAKTKTSRMRETARNDMLNFYFANGYAAEALGVLETMRADRPAIEDEPAFRMMRGAASWLMERYGDARKDLYHKSLNGNDEGQFWRALVLAGEQKMTDAAYELRKFGAISNPYPKAIKFPTALMVAKAAVELGDVKQATQYLEVLTVDGPTAAQKDQISFVSGKLKELSGNTDGAIADWESVMQGVHRPSRAKAAVARTELLLKLDLFTPKDAIDAYEKLRFVWRGDDFEFSVLRRLGGLYLDEKLYRKGLTALRQAATNFPDHEASKQVTKKMSDAFLYLYMKGGADVLPPVTAIALYDEFRELTPAGAAGDEMIRMLADRLVGIDLLDRAAFLLESQIDFRLVGEEKSKVGARLALIYILDRKYEKALESLDKSNVIKVSEKLISERVLLRAQAHIGLKQTAKALELLLPETNLKAEHMRAGIYMRAKNWAAASKSMANVVRDLKVKAFKPLNEDQALAVLGMCIAYTLDGNEAALSLATANYKEAMVQTRYVDAFKLITDPPEAGLLNYRGLDKIVQRVASFQGFMDNYRKRVADGQLSSLY